MRSIVDPNHCLQFVLNGFILRCNELCAKFEEENDDYNVIMAKALADRLAEAFAEELHHLVRTELWGYSTHENLDASELHRIKYQVSLKV